ncbi:MAG: translation elongation factor Ts [Spirochaetes bacterium]|nr:translation elongation factor Ts [Spirochaetota bacterium]
MVKNLRDMTNAGMMDCKKALVETGGNIDEAIKYLREKGIAKAAKKADRITSEGIIYSYIHAGNKIGVLVELNCETDFVAKTDVFNDLAKDIAMQIAATDPQYITRDDVTEDVINSEKDIYLQQAKDSGKPANVAEKMAEGKLNKFFSEACLIEQPFIKDAEQSVQDIIKLAISKIGENITVGRFIRYQVGVR